MKTENKSKHTPTPWKVRESALSGELTHIRSEKIDSVACARNEADAALIVRAVNTHEELLELVKELAYTNAGLDMVCNDCGNNEEENNHKPDCRIGQAIAKAEEK